MSTLVKDWIKSAHNNTATPIFLYVISGANVNKTTGYLLKNKYIFRYLVNLIQKLREQVKSHPVSEVTLNN